MISKIISSLNSEENRIHKNSLYLFFNSIAGSFFGFIFWIIVARLYSSRDIGYATAIFSSLMVISIISKVGLDISVIKYYSSSPNKIKLINMCLTVVTLVSSVITILFLSFISIFMPVLSFVRNDIILCFLVIALSVSFSLLMISINIFIAGKKAKYSSIIYVLSSILKIPFVFILVNLKLYGLLLSWGLGIIITLYLTIQKYFPSLLNTYKFYFVVDSNLIKRTLKYSLGNYLSNIFEYIPVFAFPLLILHTLTPNDNAYFYISWMIGEILCNSSVAANFSLFAENSIETNTLKKNIFKSIKFNLLLLIPMITLIIIFSGPILTIFGEEYARNSSLLQIIAVSSIPLAINKLYITIKRIESKISSVINIQFIILLISITLSYIFIEKNGLIGIGYGWLGAQLIVSGFTLPKIVKILSRYEMSKKSEIIPSPMD